MIIVISNRVVVETRTDEGLFGESANANGTGEIRIALAEKNMQTSKWKLELQAEPSEGLTEKKLPSRKLFLDTVKQIADQRKGRNWVVYVHGFNQSFPESLEAALMLQQDYGVEVILFSWPSNPGGFVTEEYRKAQQAAKDSANALDRTLEKIKTYFAEPAFTHNRIRGFSLNLLVHSLGNFLLENYVRTPIFTDETMIFDNIILHQADVKHKNHAEWVDTITCSRRVYITLNEFDAVLRSSNIINGRRLAIMAQELSAKTAIYVDFTKGRNVAAAHNLFAEVDNHIVKLFCRLVLKGERGEGVDGETGWRYDPRSNSYRLQQRDDDENEDN